MYEPVPSQDDELGSSGKNRPRLKRTEANVSLSSVLSGSPPTSSVISASADASLTTSSSTSSANLASLLSPVNPSQGPVTAFTFIKKSTTGLTASKSSELSPAMGGISIPSSKPDIIPPQNSSISPININSPFGSAALSSSSRKLKDSKEPKEKEKLEKSHKKEKKSTSLSSSTTAAAPLSTEIVPPPVSTLTATEPDWACMPDLKTTNKLYPISLIRISLVQRALSQLKPPPPMVIREPRWELIPPLTAKFHEMWRTRSSTVSSETNSLSVPIGGSVSGTSPQRDVRANTMFELPPPAPSRANFK